MITMRSALMAGAAGLTFTLMSSQAFAVTAVCTNTAMEINNAVVSINMRTDAMQQALDTAIRTVGRATAEKFDQLAKYEEEIAKNSDRNAAELRKQQNAAEVTKAMQMPAQGCRTATIGAGMMGVSARTAAMSAQIDTLSDCWNNGCKGYPSEKGPLTAAAGMENWRARLESKFPENKPAHAILGRSYSTNTFTQDEIDAAQMTIQLTGNAMPVKKPTLDKTDPNYEVAMTQWAAIQGQVAIAQAAVKEELALKTPNDPDGKMKALAAVVFKDTSVKIPDQLSELDILNLEAGRRWGTANWHIAASTSAPDATVKETRDILAFMAFLQMKQYKKQIEMDKRVGGIMLELIKMNARNDQPNIQRVAP